ncbi:hypothetical protein HW932_00190 [Allochromatium humboldtianum]|uniref:Uncharacterized protein n=1 Tax=Allochromatium humboldtianum TaxID=504901 RepID=A0A850R5J1_9GAMM|nr:hypothetical protein [Allochromatium humboldtianum]NVZ07676.1 hypothetical protein [Allochromatium humboldtianum]
MTINPTTSSLGLTDFAHFPDFARECERNKIATKAQLQWWLRYRRENGLLASGAVVEKKINPSSKRPMLLIVRPRFIEWLTNSHTAAA